ncbi:MAG: hypothetical protein JNJ63_01710 [Hyphomonadaceae bacterium]|nr:hypothetical protein [Hyphomonadaceae bacterium]
MQQDRWGSRQWGRARPGEGLSPHPSWGGEEPGEGLFEAPLNKSVPDRAGGEVHFEGIDYSFGHVWDLSEFGQLSIGFDDVPARRMPFLKAFQEPSNKRVLNALVASICKQANRDFSRGVNAPHRKTSGARRNTRFGRLVARPTRRRWSRLTLTLTPSPSCWRRPPPGTANASLSAG